MKKIFAFAIALVSMAAVMTSCNNDNADFIEQKAPAPTSVEISTNTISSTTSTGTTVTEEDINQEFDGNIYFVASEHQNEYISSNYTIQVGDQSKTLNLEELPVATTLPKNLETYFKRSSRKDDFVKPIVYVYQIPAGMSGKVNVSANLTVKEGVELPNVLDVWGGAATNVNNQFRPHVNTARNAMASDLAQINAENYLNDVTK